MNETNKTFTEWLADSQFTTGTDGVAFQCTHGCYHFTIIRVVKNADFDYLYSQRQYQGSGIERGDNFKYAGIFCKRNGQVYDGQYEIQELGEFEMRDEEALRNTLKMDVRRIVEEAIGNDRRNLRITELSNQREINSLAQYQEYTASGNARKAYLSGEYEDGEPFVFTFRCRYNPENWTEDSLLACILDPAGYAEAQAVAFIDGHQDDMLTDFLKADMVAVEYAAILANPGNPVHRVKRIMAALNASSAKTVNITIWKDGIEFTFKSIADQFRSDCFSHYSDWQIAAADRKEYKRLFGNSDYRPEDILRIEYARSVLYQAKEVPL